MKYLVLFLLFTSIVSAQTPGDTTARFTGRVIDSISQKPLEDMAVRLYRLGLVYETRTSKSGTFMFARIKPGSYTLSVSEPLSRASTRKRFHQQLYRKYVTSYYPATIGSGEHLQRTILVLSINDRRRIEQRERREKEEKLNYNNPRDI